MSDLINRFAPDFALPGITGGRVSLSDFRGAFVVLTFWSAECPWSRRADVLLVYRSARWTPRGVQLLGIASNVTETENEIAHEAERRGVRYPVLLDIEQSVANAYKAQTTPQFFVMDKRGIVRYAGALDDASFKQPRPKVLYLDRAVSALLDGRTPDPAVTLPYGCAIIRQAPAEADTSQSPASPSPAKGTRPK
ncbi:MAG: redoxin domain-containing protein [Anaerolineales bacterium]|nr:redoxin domain-containing protein [Anaerolineales bacterium]